MDAGLSAHMEPMLIDYWVRFAATPLAHGIGWAISFAVLPYFMAGFVHRFAVPGTLKAYQSATIVKTLLWPLFAGYVYCVIMDIFTQNWIGALIDAWMCSVLVRDWDRFKDTDDWWKGKGTKLKKKLKSMFTASSPATSGAGA